MKTSFLAIALIICAYVHSAFPQSSAFTYQGKLTDAGAPANGPYDISFKLFTLLSGGSQVGSNIVKDDVVVSDGIFSVALDFGTSPFLANTGNYLEISVRPGASTGAFTMLSPRQAINSSPYAVQTIRAASAVTADTATNALNLGGTPANQFTQNSDPRLSDARNPVAGSANYIQNGITQQPLSNFNISGDGTVSGTLSGNIINGATQYNLGGNRVLVADGLSQNVFAGIGTAPNTGTRNSFFGTAAGASVTFMARENSFFGGFTGGANTTGLGNSFFGIYTGSQNTSGRWNSFFGSGPIGGGGGTGFNNTIGQYNSFFGHRSGESNIDGNVNSFFGTGSGLNNSSGSGNTFLGHDSGNVNTTGSYNTTIGDSANLVSNALNYATAIGSNAVVSTSDTVVIGKASGNYTVGGVTTPRPADAVQIPGNLYVGGVLNVSGSGPSVVSGTLSAIGGFFGNVDAVNIGTGTINPNRLGVIPITNGGTGSSTQSFVDLSTNQSSIAGNKQFSGGFSISDTGTFNIRSSGTNSRFNVSSSGKILINLAPNTATDGLLTVNGTVGLQLDSQLQPGGATAVCQNSFGLLSGCAQTYVDLSSNQTLSGSKTFSNLVRTPGGVFIANPNTVIITSPNGSCWGLTVNNSGALATFPISPCP